MDRMILVAVGCGLVAAVCAAFLLRNLLGG